MNNKTRWVILGIVAWLVLYFSSTKIILMVTGNQISSSEISIAETNSDMFFGIDEVLVADDLFSTVTISGWSFIETENETINKQIKLIFSSDDNEYESKVVLHSRRDLPQVISDVHVPKINQGFRSDFSPVGMKDGEYSLYIYVYENSSSSGIINTGMRFIKNGTKFELVKGSEILPESDFSQTRNDNTIFFGIDTCEIVAKKLVISGWGFKDGYDSAENVVSIAIKNPSKKTTHISVEKTPRHDIRKVFGENYYLSGFRAEVPSQLVEAGKNRIYVIINNKYMSDNAFECYITNEN